MTPLLKLLLLWLALSFLVGLGWALLNLRAGWRAARKDAQQSRKQPRPKLSPELQRAVREAQQRQRVTRSLTVNGKKDER